jgi:hypothetical protein
MIEVALFCSQPAPRAINWRTRFYPHLEGKLSASRIPGRNDHLEWAAWNPVLRPFLNDRIKCSRHMTTSADYPH